MLTLLILSNEFSIKLLTIDAVPSGLRQYFKILSLDLSFLSLSKVNSYISLGKDADHRNQAIKGRINKGDRILDAGSGFGNMSKIAAKIVDNDLSIILYDPLFPMLKNTDRLFVLQFLSLIAFGL